MIHLRLVRFGAATSSSNGSLTRLQLCSLILGSGNMNNFIIYKIIIVKFGARNMFALSMQDVKPMIRALNLTHGLT